MKGTVMVLPVMIFVMVAALGASASAQEVVAIEHDASAGEKGLEEPLIIMPAPDESESDDSETIVILRKKPISDDPISVVILEKEPISHETIGGDTDEHGCILMAGYSWCESKQKCLRTWEEPCAGTNSIVADTDDAETPISPGSGQDVSTISNDGSVPLIGIAGGDYDPNEAFVLEKSDSAEEPQISSKLLATIWDMVSSILEHLNMQVA